MQESFDVETAGVRANERIRLGVLLDVEEDLRYPRTLTCALLSTVEAKRNNKYNTNHIKSSPNRPFVPSTVKPMETLRISTIRFHHRLGLLLQLHNLRHGLAPVFARPGLQHREVDSPGGPGRGALPSHPETRLLILSTSRA